MLCTRKFQWFCRAPPLRAQSGFSVGAGLCPARLKRETPPSFACGKIHRPCQGRQASYRKPLTGADSPLRRGHYPRWASNQPVISFRRRSRWLRLAAAGKLVVLAAEENKAALHAVRRERGVHLIPLIDGAAVILQRVDEERGRFDFIGIFYRAVLPEFLRVRPEGRAALILGEVGADIGYAVEKLVQFDMERWLAQARKRSVWPMIQLVINPP